MGNHIWEAHWGPRSVLCNKKKLHAAWLSGAKPFTPVPVPLLPTHLTHSIGTDPESPFWVPIGIHDIIINHVETLFCLHGVSVTNNKNRNPSQPSSLPYTRSYTTSYFVCSWFCPSLGHMLLRTHADIKCSPGD